MNKCCSCFQWSHFSLLNWFYACVSSQLKNKQTNNKTKQQKSKTQQTNKTKRNHNKTYSCDISLYWARKLAFILNKRVNVWLEQLIIEKVKIFFILFTCRCRKTLLIYISLKIKLQLMFNDSIASTILLILPWRLTTVVLMWQQKIYLGRRNVLSSCFHIFH